MGNTKYVAFAGAIYQGEEEFFSEQALLEVAHGDHVGVKVLHCYLHWDGESADNTASRHPYVIGHLTTHSMSGFSVVKHIADHMKSGHIQRTDVDWPDTLWLNIEDRAVVSRCELVEKEKRK